VGTRKHFGQGGGVYGYSQGNISCDLATLGEWVNYGKKGGEEETLTSFLQGLRKKSMIMSLGDTGEKR